MRNRVPRRPLQIVFAALVLSVACSARAQQRPAPVADTAGPTEDVTPTLVAQAPAPKAPAQPEAGTTAGAVARASASGEAAAEAKPTAEPAPEPKAAPEPVPADLPAPDAMTSDEYKTYQEYLAAMKDERVLKMPAQRRVPAIARNFGVPLAKLRRIIDKGERHGRWLVEANERAAREAIAKTPVSGQITSLDLVDQGGYVIAYVRWNNAQKDRLEAEATYVAKAVSGAAPLAQIVGLWSCAGPTKVFTAKIRTRATERIRTERIDDFAKTRYIRLFEDVHNLFEGKPPQDPKGCE